MRKLWDILVYHDMVMPGYNITLTHEATSTAINNISNPQISVDYSHSAKLYDTIANVSASEQSDLLMHFEEAVLNAKHAKAS